MYRDVILWVPWDSVSLVGKLPIHELLFVIHDSLTSYCVALWWMWRLLHLAREGHEHRLFHRRISVETFWKGQSLDPFFSRRGKKIKPKLKIIDFGALMLCVHKVPSCKFVQSVAKTMWAKSSRIQVQFICLWDFERARTDQVPNGIFLLCSTGLLTWLQV